MSEPFDAEKVAWWISATECPHSSQQGLRKDCNGCLRDALTAAYAQALRDARAIADEVAQSPSAASVAIEIANCIAAKLKEVGS